MNIYSVTILLFTSMIFSSMSLALSENKLEARLEAKSNASKESLSKEVQQKMQDGIEIIPIDAVRKKAPNVGEKLPCFELVDSNGKKRTLKNFIDQGSVIITFYRGGWCPYCNIQLAAYSEALSRFKDKGAQLVAISPESPKKTQQTIDSVKVEYPILTDKNNDYARKLGISFVLSPELSKLYHQFKIPLEEKADEPGVFELPLAATFVVNSDGVIIYRFIESDYKKRAEPADLLKILDQ